MRAFLTTLGSRKGKHTGCRAVCSESMCSMSYIKQSTLPYSMERILPLKVSGSVLSTLEVVWALLEYSRGVRQAGVCVNFFTYNILNLGLGFGGHSSS